MKENRVVPGVILIGLGTLLLLRNAGYFNWLSLSYLIQFWPLMLVIVGINVISKNNVLVSALTWSFLFAAVILYGLISGPNHIGPQHSVVNTPESVKLEMTPDETVEEAAIFVETGASAFSLASTEQAFIQATGFDVLQLSENQASDSRKFPQFQLKDVSRMHPVRQEKWFHRRIELNREILWDLSVKMGAVSAEFDLSDLPIERFNMEVGAGDVHLVTGLPVQDCHIAISAGASNVQIDIPPESSTLIEVSRAFTSLDIDESMWERNGNTFQSLHYDPEQPTQYILIKMGVGRISIRDLKPLELY